MTKEDYSEIANGLWKANKDQAKKSAEDLFAKHKLPPAAPILIENLAALLADLQRTSFLHGVAATLYAAETPANRPVEVVQ